MGWLHKFYQSMRRWLFYFIYLFFLPFCVFSLQALLSVEININMYQVDQRRWTGHGNVTIMEPRCTSQRSRRAALAETSGKGSPFPPCVCEPACACMRVSECLCSFKYSSVRTGIHFNHEHNGEIRKARSFLGFFAAL